MTNLVVIQKVSRGENQNNASTFYENIHGMAFKADLKGLFFPRGGGLKMHRIFRDDRSSRTSMEEAMAFERVNDEHETRNENYI